jgi:hypothetical protein
MLRHHLYAANFPGLRRSEKAALLSVKHFFPTVEAFAL